MIQGATFALGATSFEYKKEIPLMAKFVVTSSLLGFDKKWVSHELFPSYELFPSFEWSGGIARSGWAVRPSAAAEIEFAFRARVLI